MALSYFRERTKTGPCVIAGCVVVHRSIRIVSSVELIRQLTLSIHHTIVRRFVSPPARTTLSGAAFCLPRPDPVP